MVLRYDNRVAVITGAGGGLGRAYAVLLASLGAKVIVNDLGGSLKGDGNGNARAADVVVEEIRKAGGTASPNYDSVEHGDKIIADAINKYGRVDILINNAGILRDRSLAKMSDQDWDLVMLVHLKGSFICTRAAWPHMVKQNYGRIINTASGAGLYGNFGQANYSAAKLGLVAFTKSVAVEGQKKGIFSNVIVPFAGTRMTQTVFPQEMLEALTPDYIAPVVAYLCHESCKDNGSIFECGAGWVAKLRWQRSEGQIFPKGFSPDDVEKHWSSISDFAKNPNYPTTLLESTQFMLKALQSGAVAPSTSQSTKKGGEKESSEGTNAKATGSAKGPVDSQSKADKLFSLMGAYLRMVDAAEKKALCKKVNATYFWNILEKPNGAVVSKWTVSLKGDGGVSEGHVGKAAEATFNVTEPDLLSICLGKLNPQRAFLMGKLKIRGNIAAATKFTPDLFPKIPEALLELSVSDAIDKYVESMGGDSVAPTGPATGASSNSSGAGGSDVGLSKTGLKSEPLLQFMSHHLETPAGKSLVTKIASVYQFDIMPTKGATPISFTLNLKADPPSLKKGPAEKCDVLFTMLDDDFISVVKGQLSPQLAFMQGRMKIKGSMRLANKFTPDLFPKPSSL